MRAPCGDFTATMEGRTPCVGFDVWRGGITPEFLAGLPRDSQQLYDLLRRDIPTRGSDPDVAILVFSSNVVGSPLMPADLRAAFYRALGHIDGLKITDDAATVGGRRGTAFGVERGSERLEFVIDTATGEYLGSREWAGGALLVTTSSTSAVVDAMDARPAG